tara:strand:- start:153 stop:320 length:168 start_codon:yes stop_codon:yes gene_type:complete
VVAVVELLVFQVDLQVLVVLGLDQIVLVPQVLELLTVEVVVEEMDQGLLVRVDQE